LARKPRVLCLLQLPPPVHGASVMNATIAASARLARDFDLRVVELRSASAVDDVGRFAIRKLGRFAASARDLIAAIRRDRPDLVYMTFATASPALLRDALIAELIKRLGIPVVLQLHTKGTNLLTAPEWQRRLARRACAEAWVIHLSPSLGDVFAELVQHRGMVIVENGIADRYRATERQAGPVRILFLSNLREDKGPLTLLAALGLLAAEGVEFRATFAGARDSDTCEKAFAKGVRELGLADRVERRGAVYGDEKDMLFRSHDVFAFPTENDAFPLVILEALQWGLPVVSSNEGAIPEILGASDAGMLVPKREPRVLADALRAVIESPEKRQQMSERARARYLQTFTTAHYEERLTRALQRILASVAPGRAGRSARSSSAPTEDV
jgi:glycosyltransferase involved in cell wall biosynthesis